MDTDIKTYYVRQSAGGARSAAEEALDNLRRSLDSSDTAADGHHGWASAAALKRCASAWEDHMVDLGRQMNTMADHLHTTARSYDTTDAQARDAFTRLQHGLADFGGN
ncbi:excreted virulence factor EspC (type VII ESX diderm) [Streptomyces sp. 3211.6]|uniref:type VII secretion target n=1 Tax=Streptomyces sp. 3211.6 TaxID=1938845 RepID=UPI000F2253F2|nr:type VII secretion target [Streptomyces sp. 3211.6]RKT08464.1 excreted virulence factor EspC (type VII ESX diderm) [Streptomyces sp. 3211.6]